VTLGGGTMVPGAAARIAAEVESWPGVESAPHRFGGVEYRFGGREIGHVHGDGLADLPFPMRIRDELVASGQAEPHHILPDSGWVSRWLRAPKDVGTAIALFRLQYDRLAGRGPSPQAGDQTPAPTALSPDDPTA